MRSIFKGLLAAVALTALAGASAKADTLTEGGGWSTFYFLGQGSPFQDISGNPLAFTFTLSQPDVLRISEGYQGGDQFDVTINGVDQGPTSPTTPGFIYVGDCWTCAFYDPADAGQFTRAYYDLAAGTYTVTGIAIQSFQGNGKGAIALGAVPEPATWTMMLAGFFGLGAMVRRARRERALAATA